MAEVRCPMCGKANPAELDECQYCQARLRPIWASAPTGDDLSGEQASDLPEWLKSLRTPSQEQNDQPVSDQESQDALPDWLGELRKQPGEMAGPPSEEISDEPMDRSDDSESIWLQDFLGETDLPKDEIISDQRGDVFQPGNADWISRIGAVPLGEEQPQESAETLDWLTELEQAAPDFNTSSQQDWYTQPPPQPFEAEEPLPDWLFKEESGAPEGPGQETGQGLFEPESALEPDQLEQPGAQEELPDWLQQVSSSIQGPAEPGMDNSAEWTRLESAESVAPEPTGDEAVNWLAGGDEELPAWLFAQPSENEPTEAEEAYPPAVAEEVELTSEDFTEWPIAQEENLPEWLKPLQEAPQEESPVLSAAEELAPAGLFTEEPLSDEGQSLPAAEEPERFLETPEDESLPWLAGATAAMAGAEFVLGQDEEESLSWLEQLESTYGELSPNAPEELAASEGAEGLALEPGSALPIWLAKASEEEELEQEAGAESEEGLSRADLPSWLQAMKPVGVTAAAAALTGEPEPQQIEGAGPLAGLRGALPAEPDVSQAQKPPVYSIKLHVTEPQQLQAELLGSLVEAEGRPQALPRSPAIRSQDIVRLMFAVLLIFPVLFVMLTGFPQFGLPRLSMEVNEVGEIIDALAPGAPVLLAVDYQPGFSGEMDAVALPVVQHLYERGAYVALVSTISTGPVQAEHLLSQVQSASGAPLQILANTANLGYIPGGAAGLLGFAQSPRSALPTNLKGEQVWETTGLQGIDSLDQFALVVVVTENPDVARSWIEQVQPQLGATPLVMLLSAQAEPMVWPYYSAWPSQVQGLVGGLAGGAAYLARGGQSGRATQFWSPYAAGVLIAVILMVLGGIFYLILARIAQRQEKAGGEKRP